MNKVVIIYHGDHLVLLCICCYNFHYKLYCDNCSRHVVTLMVSNHTVWHMFSIVCVSQEYLENVCDLDVSKLTFVYNTLLRYLQMLSCKISMIDQTYLIKYAKLMQYVKYAKW